MKASATRSSSARRYLRQAVRRVAYPMVGAVALAFRLYRTRRLTAGAASPKRILVIRIDLLGDVVLTMPAVSALRDTYPDTRIVMLTLPYTAPLARLFPDVDDVVAVDTNRIRTLRGLLSPSTWMEYWRVMCELRSESFDLCLSMSGRMASLCALLSGARTTVGYADEAYPFTLTNQVPETRYEGRRHEVESCACLAAAAGATLSNARLIAPIADTTGESMRQWLTERDIAPDDLLVVIHAGSVNGSAKRWPPSYWARFAGELQREMGVRIVLVGAKSDIALADQVSKQTTGTVLSAVGETSIEQLVALLHRADLVATGDSGPLHLAVALRRPLLCVYGPTDPRVYGPYRPESPVRLLRINIPCSPCYTRQSVADCPLGDPICMRLVTVPEMRRAAVELLARST